jgi:predicted DNA-binding mobile mystery protein A
MSAAIRAHPRHGSTELVRTGWVRAIRDALGISQAQLAARAGISRATVQKLERAESQRRITLASLDRLAQAMGCQVAVALVPKGGSLDDLRRRQALAKAEALLGPIADDDGAKKRAIPPPARERRKQRLVTKLLRGSPRRLWR